MAPVSSSDEETRTCAFCGRAERPWLDVPKFGLSACTRCATRLGRLLLDAPAALSAVWPSLKEEEGDEPEPRLRLPDGSSVEVRERTAELKKELTFEARVQLAQTYGDLGLYREQLLECGYILCAEPPPLLAQAAFNLLFLHRRFVAKDAIEQLRAALFPG